MHTSFLYHAFGVREQECSSVRYEDNSIVLKVQTRKEKLCCPASKSKNCILPGSHLRRIRGVPVGNKQVYIEMKVQRIECKDCGSIRREDIHFVTGRRAYSNKLARPVVELSRTGTIKDVANHLHISRDTVKDIRKRYLYRHYNNPDISKISHTGIDEFAVAKGHIYKTIVVDLQTGRVIHIGDGKGGDALDGFWKKVKKAGAQTEAVVQTCLWHLFLR
jgi:transposase